MAGVGLPPFGLFFSYAAMLLQPAISNSGGLIVIMLCWFLTSWYLFRMMQRLLFGPHRADIRYEDLRPRELVSFALLLLVLALLGTKLRGPPLERHIEVVARIDAEHETRLVPVFRL